MGTEKAIFAAGCFWGVEDTFRQVPGVIEAISGYIGGHVDQPTYEQVCSHKTGHAEAVEVTFDPDQVTYDHLLEVFWDSHDPTQMDRQGPDVGDNYRSEIFTLNPDQAVAAEAAKAKLDASERFKRPIATKIEGASNFWPAEEYHQRYYEKHGLTSCHIPSRR